MIATQPVIYELPRLKSPTTLMIGDKDVTAIGSNSAPSNVSAKLRHYPELGEAAAAAIPNAKLVEFPNEQHTPQLQYPEVFHKAFLGTHLNAHSLHVRMITDPHGQSVVYYLAFTTSSVFWCYCLSRITRRETLRRAPVRANPVASSRQ